MKHCYFLMLAVIINTAMLYGQAKPANSGNQGMKDQIRQYWFVLLKTGSKTETDSIARGKLFAGHMANIEKLYYDGILKVAGPFGKNDKEWRGLFVFDCSTREEVENYVKTDPAIAAGLLAVEITPWYTAPIGSFVPGKPEKSIK